MTCPDCKATHPTEASDWSDFLHMLRSHRDPFFDDTIDALIAKLEALVAVLPEGVTVEQLAATWQAVHGDEFIWPEVAMPSIAALRSVRPASPSLEATQ